jgi:hypothetical protein
MSRKSTHLLIAGVALGAIAIPAAPADAKVVNLKATLSARNEVPKETGNASGRVTATVNTKTRSVCVKLTTANLSGPTAAHIHQGRSGKAGGVVIDYTFLIPKRVRNGCAKGPQSIVNGLANSPSGFYFNVHSRAHPAGAARGQFTKA